MNKIYLIASVLFSVLTFAPQQEYASDMGWANSASSSSQAFAPVLDPYTHYQCMLAQREIMIQLGLCGHPALKLLEGQIFILEQDLYSTMQ